MQQMPDMRETAVRSLDGEDPLALRAKNRDMSVLRPGAVRRTAGPGALTVVEAPSHRLRRDRGHAFSQLSNFVSLNKEPKS